MSEEENSNFIIDAMTLPQRAVVLNSVEYVEVVGSWTYKEKRIGFPLRL